MKKNTLICNLFLVIVLSIFIQSNVYSQTPTRPNPTPTLPTTVQIQSDSIVVRDSIPYNFKSTQNGSLYLNTPKKVEITFDPEINKYVIREKIGTYYVSQPKYMTPEEFRVYKLEKDMLDHYKDKLSAISGKTAGAENAQKNLLPTYYVNSNFFESIFGGNSIEVSPQGNIELKLGILSQNIENPQISEKNRKNTTFDFDQQITASINAKIGTRLGVTANYDTQSTFDFQNQIKLEYTPSEDDIIKKIEVGNVSMPIKNSLINGAQSLFGAKTELQFGKTTITGVFAEQKSQTRSVTAEGGATLN